MPSSLCLCLHGSPLPSPTYRCICDAPLTIIHVRLYDSPLPSQGYKAVTNGSMQQTSTQTSTPLTHVGPQRCMKRNHPTFGSRAGHGMAWMDQRNPPSTHVRAEQWCTISSGDTNNTTNDGFAGGTRDQPPMATGQQSELGLNHIVPVHKTQSLKNHLTLTPTLVVFGQISPKKNDPSLTTTVEG